MTQSRHEVALALRELKGRIASRTWVPVSGSSEGAVYVTTGLSPVEADDPAAPWDPVNPGLDRSNYCLDVGKVADFIDRTKEMLEVDLSLAGGGYGCSELGFATSGRGASIVEKAILEHAGFQALLADLRAYIARIRVAGTLSTLAAHRTIKILVATTREAGQPSWHKEKGIVGLYGNRQAMGLSHCITELDIVDGSPFGETTSLLRRTWRRFFGSFSHRGEPLVAKVVKADPLSAEEFDQLIANSGNGALLHIHGYANGFDTALKSFAAWAHRSGVERLERLPILFSWPANDSKHDYYAQVEVAEVNDRPLRCLLTRLARSAPTPGLDVLAHSHGCKVLVEVFKHGRKTFEEAGGSIGYAILVQSDVGQAILKQVLEDMMSVCSKLVIYHGADDLALRFSGAFAGADRIGVTGLPNSAMSPDLAARVEQIDTNSVARGLVRHSPHMEAPEVVADIYSVLRGEPPERRQFLDLVNSELGQWRLRRATL